MWTCIKMDKVIVLLLVLINANSTVSRNLLSRRNADPTKQINSGENDRMLTGTGTEAMQSSTDSLHELHTNIPSNSNTEKQALRQTENYFEKKATTFRTTIEDTLRGLLKKQLPFAHPAPDQIGQLDRDIMLPVTEPLWKFEDYDDAESIDPKIKEDSKTCEAQKINCDRDTDYNQPICVIDLTMPEKEGAFRQKGFHSFCEVTYRNCLKRYESTGKYYAEHYSEDYLEFYHNGWCQRCKTFQLEKC
ncbi:uncharacterized protein LOC134801050 [Cydia splendana]|uniref:uncharacterized protein LOC134801050 n=1 Tax=Cydia splendana TaxID=1100963 RepID=UPI00300C8B8C